MNNIRSVDLNLLGVFSVLMNVQNLTHAAEELGMTQSAVSHALKRLRALYNDPLFERKSGKMVPSAKAESIYPLINQVIMDVQSTLPEKEVIPPEKLKLEYRINMVNVDSRMFLQNYVARIHEKSPNIVIKLTSDLLNDPGQALRNREYDLHLDLLKYQETGCHSKKIFTDELWVVCAKDHPRLGDKKDITLQEYIKESHSAFIPRDPKSSILKQTVDFTHERKIGFESQNIQDLLHISLMTDLVSTLPYSLIEKISDKSRFTALKAPFIKQDPDVFMTWYWGVEHYPSHRWLRQELLNCCNELYSL